MISVISTDKAPRAVGPYSQAVKANGFAYLSGMLPLDVLSGEIVGLTAKEQTEKIMQNISDLLAELNLTLKDVVKTTIFIDSMNDFQDINDVYSYYFEAHKPARSCVEVSKLPKEALVEIEVIALLN